ncbi:MAG: Hsp20/alpha crystallin family protein [Candidatus Hodarchaeota archaeon]
MKNNTDNRNEDDDFNFFFDFPPFHIFCKTFPGIKPFFRKGVFSKPWEDKFRGHRVPITRVKRNQEGYVITMELPGISKDEINLEATSEELWLSARNEEFNKEYHHHLHFRTSIRSSEMKATIKAGILTITVPYVDRIPKTAVDVE